MFGKRPIPTQMAGKTYKISGVVVCNVSPAVGGLRVSIVDKNVSGDVELAAAVTDDRGAYSASFDDSKLKKRKKVLPDVQVRVFAEEKFLGASDVRYNASASETLNVTLGKDTLASLRSEYEVLTAAVKGLFTGKLGDLKESADQPQITYLANKTGWDARAVALAALADQFSRIAQPDGSAPIRPEFYYALFRAGLPANTNTLHLVSVDSVGAVWKQAIAQGVIPSSLSEEIPNALITFQKLRMQSVLDAIPGPGISGMRDLLRLRLGDAAHQEQFAQIFMQYGTDPDKFWPAVAKAFDEKTVANLKLDGQVAFLTLNNVQLMTSLYGAEKDKPIKSLLDLVRRGYYQPKKWGLLLEKVENLPVSGKTPEEQRTNYASLLSAQLRLSYPTAVLSEMINEGDVPLTNDPKLRAAVYRFLVDNEGKYELGMQPLDQYLADNKLAKPPDAVVVAQIKRLQRVYQITPSDRAMNALLTKNLDSARLVTRYERSAFVSAFQEEMGGPDVADLTYSKAQLIHSTIINIATDYVMRRRTPSLGHGTSKHVGPIPQYSDDVASSNTAASATLQTLFGALDYCACEECRSILGPAAYLVDLLNFTDVDAPPPGSANPQDVLFQRRPDLQYLPLTCANTNTELPYIDVVNEILEYFTVNGSLAGFQGYNTDDTITSDELLATPQVGDPAIYKAAYDNLSKQYFPPPLPFHRPLEMARRFFQQFDATLADAMASLRVNDAFEGPAAGTGYGWRDILMEQIGLSRQEYKILTDSSISLAALYGYPGGQSDAATAAKLVNVQTFCDRCGISFADLVSILRTQFINANDHLIPMIDALKVGFDVLQMLQTGAITPADFRTSYLPQGAAAPNGDLYGGDIVRWIVDETRYAEIMGLITINNLVDQKDLCSLVNLQLRNTKPPDFVRMARFIRLWRKLGLTIPQTDAILASSPLIAKITASGAVMAGDALSGTVAGQAWTYATTAADTLSDVATGIAETINRVRTQYAAFARDANVIVIDTSSSQPSPVDVTATDTANTTFTIATDPYSDVELLDEQMLVALPRLGFAYRIMELLDLDASTDLPALLACWSAIGTAGTDSLYASLFLKPSQYAASPWFWPDEDGNIPGDSTRLLLVNEPAIRGACNLTHAEFQVICDALVFDATTKLTLANISEVFRRGWLARKLKISVVELLLLIQYSGINPFVPPDPSSVTAGEPAMVRFIRLVKAIQDSLLDITQVLYLIWNKDVSGKSAPTDDDVAALALTLRTDFDAVNRQFALQDDPDGSTARSLLTLVYGSDAANFLFGLINGTFSVSTPYAGAPPDSDVIVSSQQHLTYDSAGRQLTYQGIVDPAIIAATRAAAAARGAADLANALSKLLPASAAAVNRFFDRYPELKKAYEAFVASTDPPQTARASLLASLLQTLQTERKEQQALATFSSAAGIDSSFASSLLTDATVMQAAADANAAVAAANPSPAVSDLLAIENQGLSARFYFNNDPSINPDKPNDNELNTLIAYSPVMKLATTPGAAPTKNDVITTTINGLDIAHTVADNGLTLAAVANGVVAQINRTTEADPDSGLPINSVVTASLTGNEITFQRRTAGTPLIVTGAVSAGATETYAPATQISTAPVGQEIAGVWNGYLNVPQDGDYVLIVASDAGASITLTIGGAPAVVAVANGGVTSFKPVTFTAGKLTPIRIEAKSITQNLTLSWQSQNIGTQYIPGEYLYSRMRLHRLRETYIRFLKATSLSIALLLEASETSFLTTEPNLTLPGTGWINKLRSLGSPDPASYADLLKALIGLLTFARLKKEFSPGDDRFMRVLQGLKSSADISTLLALTGWSQDSLTELLSQFFGDTDPANLVNLANFARVDKAYSVVNASGISAKVLDTSVTNDPEDGQVNALQSAVSARYAHADWLNVIRPINDAMRGLQRDALVAYVLQKIDGTSVVDIDTPVTTPDTLFEYLLADVEMEPCMRTSRVQFAILSVQLFIERSLRSLEMSAAAGKNVDPACFHATVWNWMKRFRLWQANREILLWPENWLYPELRDDTSPLFNKMMGKLLQSDIDEDAASAAYFDYLTDLEIIAKLEPCSMCCVQGSQPGDLTTHVVARTAGASATYYHRFFDGVSWSPWDQIPLSIDGEPVLIYVWKNRLFLFWVQVSQQQIPTAPGEPAQSDSDLAGKKLNDTSVTFGAVSSFLTSGLTSTIRSSASNTNIFLTLFWSEHRNGKWQPAKSSDPANPAMYAIVRAGDQYQFDRASIVLDIFSDISNDRLWLKVSGAGLVYFVFYNTHSTPAIMERLPGSLLGPENWRYINVSNQTPSLLTVSCWEYVAADYPLYNWEEDLIAWKMQEMTSRIVDPSDLIHLNLTDTLWTLPFLYADTCNAFYVTTAKTSFEAIPPKYGVTARIPSLALQLPPMLAKRWLGDPSARVTNPIDTSQSVRTIKEASVTQFLTEDQFISRALGTSGVVRYGKANIGPSGSRAGIKIAEGK
jgi:hypothetical protein